eukprot:51040-Hanusia_phi.AAC.3
MNPFGAHGHRMAPQQGHHHLAQHARPGAGPHHPVPAGYRSNPQVAVNGHGYAIPKQNDSLGSSMPGYMSQSYSGPTGSLPVFNESVADLPTEGPTCQVVLLDGTVENMPLLLAHQFLEAGAAQSIYAEGKIMHAGGDEFSSTIDTSARGPTPPQMFVQPPQPISFAPPMMSNQFYHASPAPMQPPHNLQQFVSYGRALDM